MSFFCHKKVVVYTGEYRAVIMMDGLGNSGGQVPKSSRPLAGSMWGGGGLITLAHVGRGAEGGSKAEVSGGVSSVINHAEGTSTGHSVKWDRKVRRGGGLGWGRGGAGRTWRVGESRGWTYSRNSRLSQWSLVDTVGGWGCK